MKLVAPPNAWAPELSELGYGPLFPVPSLAVQATLAMLDSIEIHDFIIASDKAALADCDEDGEPAPLLLNVLDIL